MATFNKFQQTIEDFMHGVHDLSTDQTEVYLSNATPSASLDAVKADLAVISATGGYTDELVVMSSSGQSAGSYTFVAADPVFGPMSGTTDSFRYVVWFNETPTSPADPLLGWWDYGSSIALNNGESLTVDFGASVLGAS